MTVWKAILGKGTYFMMRLILAVRDCLSVSGACLVATGACLAATGACLAATGACLAATGAPTSAESPATKLDWKELPELPGELGVAGPFAGVHRGALIIAGGANFPKPVWEREKAWHDRIDLLVRHDSRYVWRDGGRLPRPIAYGAAVSTPDGVVCMGGNDATQTFREVFLIRFDPDTDKVEIEDYPPLPGPCAFGAATIIDNVIYLVGGQSGQSLDTAMNNVWTLDLSKRKEPASFRWQELPAMPGPSRALNLTVEQSDGKERSLYVISGRRQQGDEIQFLKDVWQYTPSDGRWRRRRDAPDCVMAGTAIGDDRNRVWVLGGADGSLFHRADDLRDRHPGFPKRALTYHTVTDTWAAVGTIPQNHVTTIAVRWDDAIIIPSGEIRPRVRSPKIWRITPMTGTDQP